MAHITAAEIAASRKRGAEEPTIVSARFTRSTRTLEITFVHGVKIAVPITLIQAFSMLKREPTLAELAQVEVSGAGTSLYWPRLDLGLSGLGLLQGIFGTKTWMREVARGIGASKSPAKAVASRENGRTGGRHRAAPESMPLPKPPKTL